MSFKTKTTSKYGKPVMSDDEIPAIFDIPFASRLLRQSCDAIIKKCQKGQLPAFKIGKEWRFRKADIEKYMDDQINERYKPIEYADITVGQGARV